jgi:hypothetical protein
MILARAAWPTCGPAITRPKINGVERFNQSLKYEYLYRLEIPDVIGLDFATR